MRVSTRSRIAQLTRRLERAETCRGEWHHEHHDQVFRAALRLLSTEDLQLLMAGCKATEQVGQLTCEQVAAAQRYVAALEDESRRAGFESLAVLQRRCIGRQ